MAGPGPAKSTAEAWFGPEDRPALEDFWRVYEGKFRELGEATLAAARAHPELGALLRASPEAEREQRSQASRQRLRAALDGDWATYELELRAQGATYARSGLSYSAWHDLVAAFHCQLIPTLVEAYATEPTRLASAQRVAALLMGRVLRVIGEEYLATKEQLIATQREVATEHAHRLEASEERYRALFESCPVPMWVYAKDTLAFLAVNEAATRHYGYAREEFLRMTIRDIRPTEDVAALEVDVANALPYSSGRVWRHRKKDGGPLRAEIEAHDLDFAGMPARLVVANDVTGRLLAEEALEKSQEQLRQAQKMDAVGRLAGGVAHDFNNLLSVILTFSELRLRDLPEGDPARGDLEEIRKAGERAAALTRQLLAFSRQQVVDLRPQDLNTVVGNMDKMFRRVLGEDIRLETQLPAALGYIKADVTQVEQVLMNLVVNARDAMPTGGRLTLETANVTLDEAYAADHLGTKPGPHVMLAVSDTGCGMDRATQAQIFEPFFTTKEKGKGTGLGLSTVFGIVKQLGGSIWVYSEVGEGSTFKVYFPRTDEEGRTLPHVAPAAVRGNETILLVEDELPVREVATRILTRAGYHVLAANDPTEALRLCREHVGPIELLLSDVVMPGTSGPRLAQQLIATRGNMRVLFMSGYTDEAVVRHGVLGSGAAFVQKPLTPEVLATKVRDVLAAPAAVDLSALVAAAAPG